MEKYPKQETDTQPIKDLTRQTSNLRDRWQWVEATIWTDNMLTALENGVKGRKWFSLIDKVYKKQILYVAWQKVKANRGAAGIDRITTEKFTRQEMKYLLELHEKIRNDTYRPEPVRRVYIPKDGGKTRPLGIPNVIDRIAQQAVKLTIEPIFEKEFLPTSYGFRPGRGAKDALREVDRLLSEGYIYVVDADIQSYFDTIPHDRLMDKLEMFISDGKLLRMIKSWLKQDIMDECNRWTPSAGTPQGGVLSPLLANLYLHDLDQLITSLGGKIVRYADDFVILMKSQLEAEQMLQAVQKWVSENGLTLHPEKTHVGNCLVEGQGFDFLGYRFENRKRWIRQKSILKFRDKVKQLTPRNSGQSLREIINELNEFIIGWYGYFKHVTKYDLKFFDGFIRRRLRAILRRREKRPGFGRCWIDHTRWPNKYFACLNLFDMESSRRLELASQSR